MVSMKAAWVLCASALVHQLAGADTVYNWNFDTQWSGNQVTDSSGAGLVLGPRGTTDNTGQTIRNSTSLDYWSAKDYSGTGGVAILTNGGQNQGFFSGINLKLTNINQASFAQLVDKSSNPFMQVDIWNDNNPRLNQQFYTNSITAGQTNQFLAIGSQDPKAIASPTWNTSGWNTYRIELHTDGTAHGFVNGFELGSASGIQSLTDINNGSMGMLFTSRQVVIDNFKFGVVSPVPEPETYAMLLTGLAIMGVIAKRRKSRQA